jgi:hypothetical protein
MRLTLKNKRKSRLGTVKKRHTMRGGAGSINTKTAVIVYIRNITSQILNSIENKDDGFLKNNKYSNLPYHKRKLYEPLFLGMKIDYDNFKLFSDIMINERNNSIHPPLNDIPIIAANCKKLIEEHKLETELALELKILQYGITRITPRTLVSSIATHVPRTNNGSTRVTRSMTLKNSIRS